LHIDQGVKPCDYYDLITGDLQKKRNPPNCILNMTDRGTGAALRVQCSSHFVFYDILLDREREREAVIEKSNDTVPCFFLSVVPADDEYSASSLGGTIFPRDLYCCIDARHDARGSLR